MQPRHALIICAAAIDAQMANTPCACLLTLCWLPSLQSHACNCHHLDALMRNHNWTPALCLSSRCHLADSRLDSQPSSPSVPSRSSTLQPSPARSAAAPEAAGEAAGGRAEAAGAPSPLMRAVHCASVHLHLLQGEYAHALAGADALLEVRNAAP